jgi:hypothetical protein
MTVANIGASARDANALASSRLNQWRRRFATLRICSGPLDWNSRRGLASRCTTFAKGGEPESRSLNRPWSKDFALRRGQQCRTRGARRPEQTLMTEELPDELIVYDLRIHKVHCLNQVAASLSGDCATVRLRRRTSPVGSMQHSRDPTARRWSPRLSIYSEEQTCSRQRRQNSRPRHVGKS